MIGQDPMPNHVGQHAHGSVRGDIREAFVEVLLLFVAELLKMIEEEPREESHADEWQQKRKTANKKRRFPCTAQQLPIDFRAREKREHNASECSNEIDPRG